MKTATLNSDEMLKTMVAEAVKQQTQIRSAVCDITLKALQARELGLSQINSVVRNVTQGVNAGLGDKGDVEKVLADAVAGMDDALLKVVEANQVALTKLTEGGASFEESSVKKALDELEKLEDKFRDGITQGTQEAGARLTQQWASVLDKIPHGGTDTGERVVQTIAGARAASPGRHEPVARSRSESRAYTCTELRHTGQRRADGAIRGYAAREAKDNEAKDQVDTGIVDVVVRST